MSSLEQFFITDLKTQVTCEDNYMAIDLMNPYFSDIDWRNLHLKDSSCRATKKTYSTNLRTPLDGCGTTYREHNKTVVFWNEVLYKPCHLFLTILRLHVTSYYPFLFQYINTLLHLEAVKLWSWTPKNYLLIPLCLSVISLVSASQLWIEVRILIFRKRPIVCGSKWPNSEMKCLA
jgi:hypothetical protein